MAPYAGRHTAEDTKDTVAKVGFAAVLAAAMGPVGILIAALSVGISEAMDGDAGRSASEDLSRDRVDAERQWLAEDRAFRDRLRADRQRWIDDGAKPETKPVGPSKAEAAGRFWRRLWARMVVWSDDFKRGWREGWHAAKKAHNDGADWRDVARTRPAWPGGDDQDCPEADRPDPDTTDEPSTIDRPCVSLNPHGPHVWGNTNPLFVCHGVVEDEPDLDPPVPLALVKPTPPTPEPEPEPEGPEPMTAPNGPSNVDILNEFLKPIGIGIGRVDTHVDELSKLADTLERQVQQAADHAEATGQSTAAKAALDAARAMVAKLRAAVAMVSAAAAAAAEQVSAATQAAKTTKTQQDDIESTGATGNAVATAKAA